MIIKVKYTTANAPVNRPHRTLSAALRDLRACQRAAAAGGDVQGIYLVAEDDEAQRTLDDLYAPTIAALNY